MSVESAASMPAPPARLFRVDGMWCASCARAVEKALRRLPAVEDAQVNFASRTAIVRADVAPDAILRAVERLGYRAEAWQRHAGIPPLDGKWVTDVAVRLAVAAFFSMWVMMLQLVLYVGELPADQAQLVAVGAGLLSAPVVLGAAARIHLVGLRTLRVGVPGMDTLVSVGSLAAWGLSIAQLVSGSAEVWFDTSVMLVTLLLAGRLLELQVRGRSDAAIAEAMGDAGEVARRLGEDGETRVDATALETGDRIVAGEGETLPVDGVVVVGAATLDQAPLTGESAPAAAQPGARVYAGCRIVEGTVEVRVDATPGARRIDAVREQVRQAIDQRTELLATADRFVERFVPAIMFLAAATGLFTWFHSYDGPTAVLRAVSVLVITCPCALAIAAPVALSMAVGRAAQHGVLFRTFDALERAAGVDTVVFDKTGTLTLGRLMVSAVQPDAGDARALLGAAASAEWGIEHPIAVSLRQEAYRRDIDIEADGERVVVPGAGVVWRRSGGATVRVGTPSWALAGASAAAPPATDTVVAVDAGPALKGLITLADQLRPDAVDAVSVLRSRHIDVRMWSGDSADPVDTVAKELGIRDARFGQSPEAKAAAVRELSNDGRRVAFVGDGVNDAPALGRAHLGIASVGATDAAVAVAPVVLRGGGVRAVTEALSLARRTRMVVRQNLAWAVAYNLAAIPLAVFGFVAPAIGAAAMLMSSLTVLLNSLRLIRRGSTAAVAPMS